MYNLSEEVGFVSRVHLLSSAKYAVLLLPSRLWKKCRRKCRRLKMNEEKRSWMEWRAQSRRETHTTCMDMRDAHKSNLSDDVVCKS